MKKKEMVREIIQPVMEEKNFTLVHDKSGLWTWQKEVLGVEEEVNLLDMDGGLTLHIGLGRDNVCAESANRLLNTLDAPRTSEHDWTYVLSEDKERAYRNTLLDFRDILIQNCDREIEKNARALKDVIEADIRRFTLFCDQYTELEAIYSEKFRVSEKTVSEVIDEVLDRVVEYQDRPMSEIENELVGYAVLLESLLMKKDGVKKKITMKYQSSILINETGDAVNVLGDLFYVWENKNFLPITKEKMLCFI